MKLKSGLGAFYTIWLGNKWIYFTAPRAHVEQYAYYNGPE